MPMTHSIRGAKSIPDAAHGTAHPAIRTIGVADLRQALAKGLDDFNTKPSHIVLVPMIYVVVGLVAVRLAAGYDVLQLVFPLASGFALVGPLAAIGLYEMSRRRERGLDMSWSHTFNIIRSPSIGAIIRLSLLLGVIYLAWIATAQAIYVMTFGNQAPSSIGTFAGQVLTTQAGWTLIFLGCGAGFIFALLVLAIAAVSFPMLLDRNVGTIAAVQTSIAVFLANPGTMIVWGMIVTGGLILGSLPLFVGLAIVLPVLGHATWHLYRAAVEH